MLIFLRIVLITLDWLVAIVSWSFLFWYRKTNIEGVSFSIDRTFFLGLAFVPLLWLGLYFLQGTYFDVRRLYRLKSLSLSLFGTIIGTGMLFFALLLDDLVQSPNDYYRLILVLFCSHFVLLTFVRLIFSTFIVRSIHAQKIGFQTMILGGSEKAVQLYNELTQKKGAGGMNLIGFANLNGVDKLLEDKLPYLGNAAELERILEKNQIEEVIIALESTEHERLRLLVSRLLNKNISVKVLPDMFDILTGSVHITNIFGALLMQVHTESMPFWQQVLKRFVDIFASLLAILMLIPVYLVLAVLVKTNSKGPVLFFQDRIGKKGRIFKIIKFRTMFMDAEKTGPQLSSENDPRITSLGKTMRKLRLDELPQFFNVLFGEMSLVGPRPERQFFIDKITQLEPQFLELTRVRPGITSWGQVKFGYAENVDQMIQRMKFDLLYLRNRSLALDFKIMLHTIIIVVKAKGK